MPKHYGKTGNEAQRAEMALTAYELRLRGESNVAIGKVLGVSRTTVATLIKEAIDALPVQAAEDMRKEEDYLLRQQRAAILRDLDTPVYAYHQGRVIEYQGKPVEDVEARTRMRAEARKHGESLRKLWGLDMPTKSEHTVKTVNQWDDTIDRLMAELEENDSRLEADAE